MSKITQENCLAYLTAALDPERKPVAVRFFFTEEEYHASAIEPWQGKANFCQMVQAASSGTECKASVEQLRCMSSARAFGMTEIPQGYKDGTVPFKLGLYPDVETCRQVYASMSSCGCKSYGFSAVPLERCNDTAHVVIFVTNPYRAMRIVQGYTYSFGGVKGVQMFGNRAMCTECAAHAFSHNEMSVSLMCSGTRFYCGWGDDELVVGLPYGKLLPTVEGIIETLNATEPLSKKEKIAQRLEQQGLDQYAIDFRKSYYCVYQREET